MKSPNELRTLLRKTHIRARNRLSPADREKYSLCAAERIVSLPEFRNASVVMLYRSVRGELSLDSLPLCPAAAGKRFAYPRCAGSGEMTAMVPGNWETGAFGIPEPAEASSREVPPEEIDLVICPGTAFDEQGGRLGMGAGYYDRFLPRCVNAVLVMAAFEAQRAESIPREETDIPMDIIVTEEKVRRIRKGDSPCA